MSESELNIPDQQRARQAVASLGGYAHQLFTTLLAWMRIASDETLLVEVAEDFAILTDEALTMTQVKRETAATSLTLRREDARKAIISLWQFGKANPGRDVRLHFLTTAPAGKERDVTFPGGVGGIAYWTSAAVGQDIAPLRNFLLGFDWPPDLTAFLTDADDEAIRSRLLRRLIWLTGTEPTATALDTLSARLEMLAVERGLPPSDGARVLPQLLFDLLLTVLGADRRLGRLDFERAWEKATTVPVPLSLARQLGGISAVVAPNYGEFAPDPLPRRLANRADVLGKLAEISRLGGVPWIHGSSGLGKSRLASLLAVRTGGPWHVVRLRGLSPSEIRQRLRGAVATLDRPELAGVVLDDLPIPLVEPWQGLVRAIASETARLGLTLVVTSERAPLAPAPDAFAPWRVEPVAAPYLTVEDVSEIVVAAGGQAKTWTQILYLTCGGGHPLFVDARIAGLASRGWPPDERLTGLVDDGRVGELDDVRAGVAIRLLRELDPDAHTLLLRLSILIGIFDRELVMAVAETHRPLPRPGVLLDFLIGPWIESVGRDRLKLSPLLGSAGVAGLGDAEQTAVRNATVDHLVARRPLNADFLSQLLVQALAARNMRGLMFIAGAVLTAEDRRAVALACMPLAFLVSKGGRLVPENHGISASLRLAQVVAVTAEPSHSQLPKILQEADAEFEMMPEPIRSGSKFTMLLSVLAGEDTDIAPSVWVPRLLEYIAMEEGGAVPRELIQGLGRPDMGGLAEDQFFFLMRSNRISGLGELEELFGLLGDVEPARRRSWLSAATTLLGGPPLFIQTVWSKLAMAGGLDVYAAVATYRRLATVAEGWQESVVAVECHRAAAIVLDEYVDDKEGALAQLDAAEILHTGDPGLARTRAAVLAHAGRHDEATAVLSGIRADYSSDEPLERSLMLQAAATSAAKTGAHRDAATLYIEAHAVSDGVVSLEPGVRVGLLCDAAVELGAEEDWPAALAVFADAHLAAEALSEDTSDRSWVAVQAISQVGQWLNARHEGRPTLALQDHPGTWSLLKPTLPEDRTGEVGLDTGLACAVLLEARLAGVGPLSSRFDQRERDGLVTPLSALAVRGGQLASATDTRDAAAFADVVPRFVAASRAALQARETGSLREATPISEVPAEAWSGAECEAVKQVTSEFLAELILDRDSRALKSAEERILAPDRGLDRIGPVAALQDDYASQALAALDWLVAPGLPDSPSLVHATITLFRWLTACSRPGLKMRVWHEVRSSWRDLDVRADGALVEDKTHLETILEAGTGSSQDFARTALAGAEAVKVPLHPSTVAMLESAS